MVEALDLQQLSQTGYESFAGLAKALKRLSCCFALVTSLRDSRVLLIESPAHSPASSLTRMRTLIHARQIASLARCSASSTTSSLEPASTPSSADSASDAVS